MVIVRRDTNIKTKVENYFDEFDPKTPPEVILDTHIWLSMSASEEQTLQRIRTVWDFASDIR